MVGCAAPQPTALTYSIRHLSVTDSSSVILAAQRALVSEGYRIDRVDEDVFTITTQPLKTKASQENIPRTRFGGPHLQLQRLANIRLVPRGDTIKVHCKVLLQEYVTEMHRFMNWERQGLDTPNATPIQREGATTVEQNTVWRTIRRDKQQERRILETITASMESGTS